MKFTKFKNIYERSLGFLQDDVLSKLKSKESLYFYQEFNKYLKIEEVLFCYQMIEEGFEVHFTQEKKLNNLLVEKIENQIIQFKEINNIKSVRLETKLIGLVNSIYEYSIDLVSSINDKKITAEDQKIINFLDDKKTKQMFINYFKETFKNLNQYYHDGIDSTGDFYTQKSENNTKVRLKLEKVMYIAKILMKTGMVSIIEIDDMQNEVKKSIDFMMKHTEEKYREASFTRIGKQSLDRFIAMIKNEHKDSLLRDNKKEVLLKQLKTFHSKNKSLSEEIKDLVDKNEYSIENLPIEAKIKIDNINQLSKELKNKEVNEFLHERLPIILKKYFSIDQEYRVSLKNVEGFNAQELMIQSLENIEKIILAKKEDNNYDLLSELSVENRKLKVK